MTDERSHGRAMNTLPRLIGAFESIRIFNDQPPIEYPVSRQRQAIEQGDDRLALGEDPAASLL